ncbi:MAG: 50S ribosomal protein L11 methyltransferase [Desulfobulbales bacterium]|nr:50S ribosomal protein L11 methyltransferase [Desulfobulbales bacterium]
MSQTPIKHRPVQSWQKITIQTDPCMTEAVSAYLAAVSGTGLEITSPDDCPGNSFPFERVIAYIPTGPGQSDIKAAAERIAGLRIFLSGLRQIFPDCPEAALNIETIKEEDWGRKWKSYFTSFNVTPTLIIKPSWQNATELEIDADGNKSIIEMDPGLAFGTGHHASTQLALLLLEELFQNSTAQFAKVLDVGTGSGILAMACGLFGAAQVLAVDNDPDAVMTARQNIARNRLAETITVSSRDIRSLPAGFDLVVANITHNTLADLAQPLTGLMLPHGYLVLSGILQGNQEHYIATIYAKLNLQYIKRLLKDEWVALQFKKAAA